MIETQSSIESECYSNFVCYKDQSMKIYYRVLLLTLVITSCTTKDKGRLTHNGLPIIKATQTDIDFKVGDDWFSGWWTIALEVENDTLQVICFGQKETFRFATDLDSIEFEIEPGESKNFYVLLHDSLYAHTIIQGVPFQSNKIIYDSVNSGRVEFMYQTEKSEYLSNLMKEFPLEFNTNEMSDKEIVLAVLNWTNSRWQHDGNNLPKKNDAISILKEAEQGGRFPCFAYAIVLRDQLTALGYNARTVYLKTQDAEVRESSPGHVATEVFLNDLEKWVFVDGQFNVLSTLNGKPLNAIEFQNAISNHYDELELESLAEPDYAESKRLYVEFVYDYLFYIDTALDNRYDPDERFTINGKRSLMLVPKEADNLAHINFWDIDIDFCIYTNSAMDFYSRPN